jgi:DNA-binding transcriptional LysR family regulator
VDAQAWLGVEFRHLAALEGVGATRSFRGAADRLGYVPSAVSQQISRLEELVGVRLVDRTRGTGPVELTDAGRVLLEHVKAIVARCDAARADLAEMAGGRAVTLRVGMPQCVARALLPRILRQLEHRWPGVTVIASESLSDLDRFGPVARGELDLAFATLPLEPGPFEALELLTDRCVLLVPARSPHARRSRTPSLAELARMRLIAWPQWRMASLVRAQLRTTGIEPACALSGDSEATVQALVGAGLGSAILPLLAVDADDPATAIVELGAHMPGPRLALFWHAERLGSPALRAFCDAAWTAADQWTRERETAALGPVAA